MMMMWTMAKRRIRPSFGRRETQVKIMLLRNQRRVLHLVCLVLMHLILGPSSSLPRRRSSFCGMGVAAFSSRSPRHWSGNRRIFHSRVTPPPQRGGFTKLLMVAEDRATDSEPPELVVLGNNNNNNNNSGGGGGGRLRQEQQPFESSSTAAAAASIRHNVKTPHELLHPDFAGSHLVPRVLSLDRALQAMRAAIETLLVVPPLENPIDSCRILRLEQVLDPTDRVDPLAWLHAQVGRPRLDDDNHLLAPHFYFANHEGTVEAACCGSAYTVNETARLFAGQQQTDDNDQEEQDNWLDRDWPSGSVWYGLEPFDAHNSSMQPLWFLPTVELVVLDQTTSESLSPQGHGRRQTKLAVHLVRADHEADWSHVAQKLLQTLEQLSSGQSDRMPPTTLPPILSRESNYNGHHDGQELYERAVRKALTAFTETPLQKVVLARKQSLWLGGGQKDALSGLDILRRWKYGGHEGGHLFWVQLPGAEGEFFGCTPERLFCMHANGSVISEALAGTRPRGSSQEADAALLQDLFASEKDRQENLLTGQFVEEAFDAMCTNGWVTRRPESSAFFVRRLLHLQHICRRYAVALKKPELAKSVIQFLLTKMHPTPAVCGLPLIESRDFIRQYEAVGFDRGYYAGPVGYIGRETADIAVAIRSGALHRNPKGTRLDIYAGAGIVPGSTLEDEWAETNYKFAVISSIFPQSPLSLQSASTANIAWATAFVEELIRNGVRQFYVCPGSRSTPLVVAIARATRSHVSLINAVSVHDERAAGFRAVGYGRGNGRPAAVVTSSGTAVANLYPAIVEAGMDGVPMLVLTADRAFESRDSGANQAIDQVKAFSSTYLRWFRDVVPPTDEVPVSVVLSDAGHAVSLSRKLRGPVHLNIQFRENLAPEAGPIRNDGRVDSVSRFNPYRFTDVPGFSTWSSSGGRWTRNYAPPAYSAASEPVQDMAELIANSRRGILVIGNLRLPSGQDQGAEQLRIVQAISDFAQKIGFPVFAGVQSASMRFGCPAVVPFAEHLLKCPIVADNMKPDLVFQIGAPLVSTEILGVISSTLKIPDREANHVLLHPHIPHERADPNYTVTHRVSSDVIPFLEAVSGALDKRSSDDPISSELAPLVLLGRKLQVEMEGIIHSSSSQIVTEMSQQSTDPKLTEPQIAMALSKSLAGTSDDLHALFLSNSMPVRDSEFFLYPFGSTKQSLNRSLHSVGTNRGASGIDGIISSAMGFAESAETSTTLLIGDLATLHDLNSFHSIATDTPKSIQAPSKRRKPITTVIVNNDGGGIFSFLPVARHGADVAFEDFFGTPTNAFSFEQGAAAFGLPYQKATEYETFLSAYSKSQKSGQDGIVEAQVAGRTVNVAVHREITRKVQSYVTEILGQSTAQQFVERLSLKTYAQEALDEKPDDVDQKTMVLLHGWMGDKSEWDEVGMLLSQDLGADWTVLSVDLPGHGSSMVHKSSEMQAIRSSLNIDGVTNDELDLDSIASTVLKSLYEHHSVEHIDAVAGYSLGGRVALAMRRLASKADTTEKALKLIDEVTSTVLLSSYPGELVARLGDSANADRARILKDRALARRIESVCDRACLSTFGLDDRTIWDSFLRAWYISPIWGSLQTSDSYTQLVEKRSHSLSRRGRDLAEVLSLCTPPKNEQQDWRFCPPETTLFIAGSLDKKYAAIGSQWEKDHGVRSETLPGVGHAVLSEAPDQVTAFMLDFICRETCCISASAANDLEPTSEVEADGSTELNGAMSKTTAPSLAETLVTDNAQDSEEGPFVQLGSLDYERFSIDLVDSSSGQKILSGIGWGDRAEANTKSEVKQRIGFVVELESSDGLEVGLGEVSPLPGLHPESLEAAKEQLEALAEFLRVSSVESIPSFLPETVLRADGALRELLIRIGQEAGIGKLLPSVRSGLEMALLSLASQKLSWPIHQVLGRSVSSAKKVAKGGGLVRVNGLIARSSSPGAVSSSPNADTRSYQSLKVKVGYQDSEADRAALLDALQRSERQHGRPSGMIRADANRAWTDSQAIAFASSLDGVDIRALERIEFVEEPLQKVVNATGGFQLELQISSLERWFEHTAIPYALDESLADLVFGHDWDFTAIKEELSIFEDGQRGCAAFVLKPALLGLELSIQIARYARSELGIAAVFSSSFDSGIGLAFTSFLAALSDQEPSKSQTFAHGVGTFTLLGADTLSPPFSTYVDQGGVLNVPSLSRAVYGLCLDEMRASLDFQPQQQQLTQQQQNLHEDGPYEASTATSSSGKEISVVVSLALPFSAEIGSSRFTDLPQQSRWSPWISSVSYQGKETEWTINVRGITLKWRAISEIVEEPYPGIRWQSVSGLSNRGIVEFVPETAQSSQMNVRMTLVTPRVLKPLFQGTSVFLEDFLRDKVLKWSLEMFRDVVSADLALQRGDVELGDTLYSAVEDKSTALKATLKMTTDDEDTK